MQHLSEWKHKYVGPLPGIVAILVLSWSGFASARTFGDPLPGLTADQGALFDVGRDDFREVQIAADGLGPIFNAQGCAICHAVPAVGGSSSRNEVRAGVLQGLVFDPLANQGGSLFQIFALRAECREFVPPEANVIAERQTQPLFGMGLIEAIPRTTIEAGAVPKGDGIFGKVPNGRFGWKGQVPTLLDFSGDAYLNEMGITNDLFPNENAPNGNAQTLAACDAVPDPEDEAVAVTLPSGTVVNLRGIDNFTNFMTFLAPPPRGNITADAVAGEAVFNNIGCAKCHTPSMRTDPSHPIAALRDKEVNLFSDLLLHDVGDTDGDGIPGDGIADGNAGPNELRTPPLWGLRASGPFLHDGSAKTIEQAILAHGGEASAVIARFLALGRTERFQLLAFLNSL